MFFSFIWMYIIPTMIISPILTISLNSWFSIWMSLEFNLMSFIPLIIFLNKFYKEISMKYFIIQSLSSSILILSSNMQLIIFNNFKSNIFMYMNILINLSLLIKIGAAPFHFWFINMMNNMNWLSCLILSTWQKISPMILIMYNYNEMIIYLSILFSSIISAIFGLNHQSIRLILSYSSINHMSWMMMNFLISEMMWILYFFMYSITNFSIMIIFYKLNIFYLNQIFMLNNFKTMKMIMLMNMFSISGLPPMFGFLMKWMSINFINLNNNFLILMILLFSSLLSFMFYTRISISFMMLLNLNIKMIILNKYFNMNKMKMLNFFLIMMILNLWFMNIWMF